MNLLHSLFGNMSWELGLATVGAMVAVVAAAAGIRSMFFSGTSDVVARLERTVGRADPVDRVAGRQGRGLSRVLQPFAWVVRPKKAAELSRLRLKLVQAGYRGPFALEAFLAAKVFFAFIATVVALQVNAHLVNPLRFPIDMVVTVWTCVIAFFAPNFWLGSKIRERQQMIDRALPDAMDLLVTCVEAGLGIDAAIARVSEEIGLASPLLGAELNLTFLEAQAGVPRPDAFRRLAERTGVESLKSLSAMLIQTELFGTSVARALRVHSDGMRIKRMQRAEERAAMVGVKMTIPLVLFILPSLIAVLLGPAMVSIFETMFTKTGGQ
jgi:tight adherence protein C